MFFKKEKFSVKTIVQAGLLIALALVIRNLSYMVYFGGAPGMRVGFSGIFTKMIALLFGPILGGVASGIVDIMGFVLNPQGAYIPFLTCSAVLGGILTGALWSYIKNVDMKKIQTFFICFFALTGFFGIMNYLICHFAPNSFWANTIIKLGKYKDFATIGLSVIAIIGLLLFVIGIGLKKFFIHIDFQYDFLKILIVTGISGLIVTTLNTFILQLFIPGLGKIGFLAFWIPRVIQEIFMTIIQSYIVSLLLAIYKNNIEHNHISSTN